MQCGQEARRESNICGHAKTACCRRYAHITGDATGLAVCCAFTVVSTNKNNNLDEYNFILLLNFICDFINASKKIKYC